MKAIKIAFLFGLSAVSVNLSAQYSLQSDLNVPRPDDELTKQQVEYKNSGQSGENVVWNFSQLTSVTDGYTLDYFSVGDTAIVGIEHNTRYYYSLVGDSLLCLGYENSTTQMIDERPELLLQFPV
ncbi:MAG: T9SS C-terminal target domain-containing protein, partial [Bacteroidales bacterium]|nr:T9SS C-terminal target domain-containing protein [Bacteroidales bacterium]